MFCDCLSSFEKLNNSGSRTRKCIYKPESDLAQNQLKELPAENSCGGAIYSAHSDLMDEETRLH